MQILCLTSLVLTLIILKVNLRMTPENFAAKSYDYVIIGGGTAGLTLGARLTEDPAITVAVLEAGANRLTDPTVQTPTLWLSMMGNPKYDWCHTTVPQVSSVLHLSAPNPRKRISLGGFELIGEMGDHRFISKVAKLSGHAEKCSEAQVR
jgi:GMC oxidoreductase